MWIGSIYGSGNVFLGANRLTVGTNGNNTRFSGVISNDGQGGSLAKVGSGVLTLQANNCIADTVGLILVRGSIIKLDFTGPPDTIASLVVNGVPQPPGVYGSMTSGAPHPLPEFAGPGTVYVGSTGPPFAVTSAATNVASFSATLNGSVNSHGLTTSVYFQYGTTASYGLTTAPQTKTGNTDQSVSANVSGLSSSTTYHFRIVTTNSAGTSYGSDRTFTTLPPTGFPVVTTNPATNVATFAATLNGLLDPHGLTTTVYFQYGPTTSYGNRTPNRTKSGNNYQNVSANISGLSAHTTCHFRIVATNSAGTSYGNDRTITLTSMLGSINTRSFVQTADNVMIGGFTVEGTQPKMVIIRAIGPELTQYGIANALHNPRLELHNGAGALIASNDNWQTTIIGGIITHGQVQEILNSGRAPTDARESAIIANLPAGNYTAIVRGVNNTTGVALVEVYDPGNTSPSILRSINTRSFVQTGDNVMISGFIVEGNEPKMVMIRAIGPELTQLGVPNVLANPTLELHNGTGALIASNDNWQTTIIGGIITHGQVQEILNSGRAPTDARESAIIATLPPGNYTAIVRGVNSTTGLALFEVYDLQ